MRIVIVRNIVSTSGRWMDWQGHNETRAVADAADRPNSAVVPLDDASANRQANASAIELSASVESLKDAKDAFCVLLLEPDAVVGNRHLDASAVLEVE
jgi:hypothetical protein